MQASMIRPFGSTTSFKRSCAKPCCHVESSEWQKERGMDTEKNNSNKQMEKQSNNSSDKQN